MAQRDDLFDLICSMAPNEKRYFKLHADKHSTSDYKSQYEKLFDAINNWEIAEFDEKEFRKKNKGKTFIKNLSFEKGHLYDLILKTLRNYNSQQTPAMSLHEMIININLLINKGLRSQAYKLIEKAEKLAIETEHYNEMLSLVEYLQRLYRMAPAEAQYKANDIMKRGEELLAKIALTQRAVYLRIQMVDINAQNTWDENKALVVSIIDEADSLAKRTDLSRVGQLSLLNVKQFYFIHKHRYRDSLELTAPWLEKIETEKIDQVYSTHQYLVTLANYLLCAFRCEELHLLPPTIAKIKALKALNENEASDCFRLSTQYEFLYMLNTNDFDNASFILKQIETGMDKYKHIISERQIVNFQFNIVLLYFLQKNYKETLRQINHLYHLCGRDERYALTMSMSRVIEWMCQVSVGNYNILDSSLRNLKKYFKDRDIRNEFFDILFELFTKIIKEAGLKPASKASAKARIDKAEAPPEWEQLKDLAVSWIF